jgi:hypothetical protein
VRTAIPVENVAVQGEKVTLRNTAWRSSMG